MTNVSIYFIIFLCLQALAWHSVAELEAAQWVCFYRIKTSFGVLLVFFMYPGGSSSWRPFGRRRPQERCHCLSSSKKLQFLHILTPQILMFPTSSPYYMAVYHILIHSNMSNCVDRRSRGFLKPCSSDEVWALRLGEHRPQTSQCHFLNTLKVIIHLIINN